jgi:hypothetical protein
VDLCRTFDFDPKPRHSSIFGFDQISSSLHTPGKSPAAGWKPGPTKIGALEPFSKDRNLRINTRVEFQ